MGPSVKWGRGLCSSALLGTVCCPVYVITLQLGRGGGVWVLSGSALEGEASNRVKGRRRTDARKRARALDMEQGGEMGARITARPDQFLTEALIWLLNCRMRVGFRGAEERKRSTSPSSSCLPAIPQDPPPAHP